MTYIDLHLHTYYSDGTDSPNQVIKIAKSKNLDLIAIADHDSVYAWPEAKSIAKNVGIKIIPAVEITTIDNHVLGYGFSPKRKKFLEFIKYSQELQKKVSTQRVKILQEYGVPISMKKVENQFPSSTIGKYTIIMTMIADPVCRRYLEKNHKGFTVKDIFNFYLRSGNNPGIAGDVEKREYVSLSQAVDEIHKADGIAILAHPAKTKSTVLELKNILDKVDGVECQPDFGDENLPFENYAKENNKLITYGSDYHGAIFTPRVLGREKNIISTGLAEWLTRWND